MKWGIISTADINRKVIPGAHASAKVDLVAVASRDQARADAYAKRVGDPARVRHVRDAARRRRDRGGLHLAAEHDALRVVDQGARGRQARALREAALARTRTRSPRRSTPPSGPGRLLSEAFMYRHNPQTKRLKELVDGGAIGELRLIRSAFSYSLYDEANIRLRTDVEGGALMDVGCYNVSGSRLLGGEPRAAYSARRGTGRPGTDWVFAGVAALPGRRARDASTAARRCRTATSSRRSAARARSSSTTRGTATTPVIELRRDDGVERIELEPRGLVPARAREPERRDPRRGRAAARPRRRDGAGARRSRRCTSRRRAARPSRCDRRRGARTSRSDARATRASC